MHPFFLAFAVGQVLSQSAVFDTTIYLHRAKTHMSLTLHPVLDWLFRLKLWLTTGQSTKEWVAIHRKHHSFTDEEGDPHSPVKLGFLKVQLGNVFYYIREAKRLKKSGEIERYSIGINEDWWDRTFFNRGLLGLGIGISILCWILGIKWGLTAAGVHALTYVFGLTSSINGFCHHVGYKNFDNTATNVRALALLAGGEGEHNNHHEYPTSPKFSWSGSKKREFDPAWPIIKVLVATGLAKRQQTIEERLSAR